MINNRYLSAGFKAVLCLAGLAGILIQCGVFGGEFGLSVLRYYTLLSNVLCVLYFGAAAVFAAMGRGIFLPRFKGMVIMCITVTGIVFHFMLSGTMFSMGGAQAAASILLHYVTPIMAVLDWLLFDEKGRYTAVSPLLWTVLPDAYFVLGTIYGFTLGARYPFYGPSRFPYFFMDYDMLGVWRVLLYVLVMNLGFIALGYIYYLLDRLMARKRDSSRC